MCQQLTASQMTLRGALESREGRVETDWQIRQGRRAWAVERTGSLQPRGMAMTIVFGTCASDAKRRASAPGRLAEEVHDDVTRVALIDSSWDEPFIWPWRDV